MKQNWINVALFGAIAFTSAAFGETSIEPIVLDEIVVTATRFKSTPESSPVNVTVITAEDIKKSSAKTIPTLLAQHAGIQVRTNDGTPDMAIDLRGFGMTGNQNTLVLLDGQQLNDIELTSIRWSAIPLDSIERIEIANGSGAVLYGGGATGGTINIITKHPSKEARGSAAIGYGSYDSKEWQLALSKSGERIGMRITASGLDTANYRANNNVTQNNFEADVRGNVAQGEAILKFGADKQNLRLPGERKVDPSNGINQLVSDPRGTSKPLDYAKFDGWHTSLGTTQQLSFGDAAAELSYRNKNQQAFLSGSYLETSLNLLSFTPRVKIPFQLGALGHELIVGVDMADWDYDSRRASSPASIGTPTTHILGRQSNRALYVQNTTQLSAASKLTIGARSQQVDYQARDAANTAAYASSNQGRTANAYEIGLRHKLNQDVVFFGRIGRSFRIATVDEIFDQYGVCDPNTFVCSSKISMLEPQTSRDNEVGIDYKHGKDKIHTALFMMNLNNEVHFNALTFTNMNLSPTRRYGLELEGTHDYSDALTVIAAYSYTVAKFREGVYSGINVSGNNIPLVPRQRLVLSSSWKISEKNALNASAIYVGKQHFDNDQANTFGQQMPAYTTVDMKLSHRQGAWLATAALNNLLNKKYFTYGVASTFTAGKYNAYPMQERNFSLNATYEF
jgi:iron complex outermembrane recepter protein